MIDSDGNPAITVKNNYKALLKILYCWSSLIKTKQDETIIMQMLQFVLLFWQVVEFNEPTGWIVIPLKDLNEKLVRTFMLQIAVLQNHQQVRDWGAWGGVVVTIE